MINLIRFSASTLAIILMAAFSFTANAAVTFEGFYKITRGGQHTGFFIARKETTAAGMKLTDYFSDGKETAMSVYEVGPKFNPLSASSRYRGVGPTLSTSGRVSGRTYSITKTIEAGVKASEQLNLTLPGDVYFDIFLPDYIKMTKGGFPLGTKMVVIRLVDEPGVLVSDISLTAGDPVGPHKTTKIDVRPKDAEEPITFFVTAEGEIARILIRGLRYDLVPSLSEAVGKIPADMSDITATFGTMPKGLNKVLTAPAPTTAAAPAAPAAKK